MALGIFARKKARGGSFAPSRFYLPGFSAPPARNTREWMDYYGKSSRLAVVSKIASDLAAAPGKLYQVDTRGNRKWIESHPFLEFWASPNPLFEMTDYAIWQLIGVYYLIKGEGMAVIERGRNGYPVELWPVPPHWVTELPSRDRPYYTVTNPNGHTAPRQIDIADMYIEKRLNPLDPLQRGLGEVEGIGDEVEADEYAAKFQKRFFWNNATPPIIVSVEDTMDPKSISRLESTWIERFGGHANAHKPAFIPGKLTVNKLTDTQQEMGMVEFRRAMRDACIQHFGVPPEIMGIVENSNRATIDAAKLIYAENVLKPRLVIRQKAINRFLIRQFGDGLLWEYDDITPNDQAFTLQMLNDGLRNGTTTVDEWRKGNGLEPLPGGQGDVFLLPFNVVPVKRGEGFEATSINENQPQPLPIDASTEGDEP